MSHRTGIGGRLSGFFAIATLPAGVLAFMFGSLQLSVAVFVVGWLLLVPASPMLFGTSWEEEMETVVESQEAAERLDGGAGDGSADDPVDELRGRYARGEIDEAEFERRLEALLETEGVDADDEAAVERAVDRLDDERDDETGRTDVEFERE